MKDFTDNNVYIVGGSSGIGLAAGVEFAKRDANVIVFARRKKPLVAAKERIATHAVSGRQRFAEMNMDATEAKTVRDVFNRAIKNFGPPDILINCAGRSIPDYFEKITEETLQEVMRVNLYATWNAIAALLPQMKKRGGVIVNVSSIAGFLGAFGFTAYSASKFAVIGFSEALASEVRRYGIFVSVLCPPDTDTPGLLSEDKTKPHETRELSKNAKLMTPEKVARALIRGIEKNKFMIIPGFDGKWMYHVKRLFPNLAMGIMGLMLRTIQKKMEKPIK